ncbi:MAG TPA: hypothetical protein V6C65_07640 [Allocoleopsis sp.]
MTAVVIVVCLIFLPLIAVKVVAIWWADSLISRGLGSTWQYWLNALAIGLLLPGLFFVWNTIDIISGYTPDKCGSWWFGASERECTLSYYLFSRTLALFVFLLAPYTALCLLLSFNAFWNAKKRMGDR